MSNSDQIQTSAKIRVNSNSSFFHGLGCITATSTCFIVLNFKVLKEILTSSLRELSKIWENQYRCKPCLRLDLFFKDTPTVIQFSKVEKKVKGRNRDCNAVQLRERIYRMRRMCHFKSYVKSLSILFFIKYMMSQCK